MERVGRFELRGLLGQGGMGEVWRAHDPRLGRDVALKLLRAGGSGRSGQRLRVEAQAAAALVHPHVVRLHEVGEEQGRLFLVMDLVEGESLRARLARGGRLSPQAAVEIAAALADALAAAHARGISHRDLKPENVLLAGGTWPLLTDFGLARVEGEERLTRTGELLGTPGYMAPEQLGGDKARLGPACDVFALGVVLFELLTGQRPFQGETLAALARAVMESVPPRPSRLAADVDVALDDLCVACLGRAPESRPPMAEVARALRGWRAGPGRHLGGRSWWLITVAAAAALLGTTVFVVSTIGPPAPEPGAAGTPRDPSPTPEPTPEPTPLAQPRPAWFERLPAGQRPPGLPATLRPSPAQEGVYLWPIHGGDDVPLVWIAGPEGRGGFFLGRHELTWAQFKAYLRATGEKLPTPARGELDNELRIADSESSPEGPALLCWNEAAAFCAWAGLRLPSLGEWRWAARDEPVGPAGAGALLGEKGAAARGQPGPSGCLHLVDNAKEWVRDRLVDHPALIPQVVREPIAPRHPGREERLLCGGSFLSGPGTACDGALVPVRCRADSGLRVALDAAAETGAPALLWSVEATALPPSPAGQTPPWTLRDYPGLVEGATQHLALVLPHLELKFGARGPGALPQARGLPGADAFPPDDFGLCANASARLGAGRWCLTADADEAVRVWLDGQVVIDCWRPGVWHHEQQPGQLVHRFQLDRARLVELRVEFAELRGDALLRLGLAPDPA